MPPRKRRRNRQRVDYPSIGVLSDPTSVERIALAVATTVVGELTPREHALVIELSHFFSATLIDCHDANDQLAALVLELRRMMGD